MSASGHERVLAYDRNGEAEFRMNEYFATLVILVVGTTAFSGLLSLLRRHLLRWQLTEVGRAH
jgi:hypothetical protein